MVSASVPSQSKISPFMPAATGISAGGAAISCIMLIPHDPCIWFYFRTEIKRPAGERRTILFGSRHRICQPPLKAFKELPDSMPYSGAFTTHAENPLIPHVAAIESAQPLIVSALGGEPPPRQASGDFGFLVRPLPKISLVYIFYRADDDFPASVTCLFSNNAADFLPTDGLADVGEYTSKKILALLGNPPPSDA
ncbi:MAG: DUF3786 domain-containing protein [Desulfobacterales bacterium]